MKKLLCLLLFPVVLTGCSSGDRFNPDVSKIQIPGATVHRYDLDLFRVDLNNLQPGLEKLKPEYMFFLDTDLGDPDKLSGMKGYLENERNIQLSQEVAKKYPDLSKLGDELADAFRHYRYYYPQATIPRVYTYISGCDYDHPVQVADSVMLIAIDTYLGKDYKVYEADGVPLYKTTRMQPEYILPECVSQLCAVQYPSDVPGNNLLEQMVFSGKRLFFMNAMIPGYPDNLVIGYTPEQWDWITKNEVHVWAAILENQMLYSTSGQVMRTFLADGPFTADFTKDSPPRLGDYIGWQIVTKYMEENPDVTLQELMQEPDAQKILSRSRYKPKK